MPGETIILILMMLGLTLYALLGGADFGAGVWDLATSAHASEKERNQLYHAIGPVWEANHVWLIFAMVGLFTAFPPAFAALGRALWIPLLLALVGIVFRGAGFAFRSRASASARDQNRWGAVFALASTAAPFFLGAAVGAVASGRLAVTSDGGFTGDALADWISPTSIFCAFFGVGVCAHLAALYLTREVAIQGEADLTALWRRRALATGVGTGILAMAGLAILATDAPLVWTGFKSRAWPLVAASAIAGFASLVALWKRSYSAAVCGGVGAVAAVIWGLGAALYPALVPPAITIASAKAPDTVLTAMIWSIAAGMVILVPSFVWLFMLFKGRRPA